jgi:N-acetylglutamate synthase-like GNAT family acetyltransferase
MQTMDIIYQTGLVPDVVAIIKLYKSAGLNRPVDNQERIRKMYANSNLVVSAWHEDKLVGIARSLTDFCYCCYLSDLAVSVDYQKSGIGKQLIEHTRQEIGEQTTLILLSAPAAMGYYPKAGFTVIENGFFIPRKF